MPEAIDPAALRERLAKIAPPAPTEGGPDRSALFERLKSSVTEAPDTSRTAATGAGLWQGLKESVQEAGRAMADRPMSLPGMRPNPAVQAAQASQERLGQSLAQEEAAGQKAFQGSPAVAAHPNYAAGGRLAGNLAPAVAGGMAAGPLGAAGRGLPMASRVATGMAGGGLGGAIQPTDPTKDYESQKKQQIALGLGVGGAIPAAGGVLAPQMPNLQLFEQARKSIFPALSRFLDRSEERTADGFQRAVLNQALEPIGGEVPRNMKAGTGLMDRALDQFSQAYDKVKPNLHFDLSNPELMQNFKSGLDNIAGYLTPDVERVFRHFMKNDVNSKFDQNFMMDGEAYKQATSVLSSEARRLYRTQKDDLGQAYDKVRDLMGTVLKQQNPQDATILGNIDRGYAMLKHAIYGAAKPEADGKFSPGDILHSLSRTSSDNQMATGKALGDGLLQGYAKLGRQILGGGRPRPGEIAHVLMTGLGEGLGARVARSAAQATTRPLGRSMKAGTPGLSPAAGAEGAKQLPQYLPQDKTRQRLKAAQKVGELSSQRYQANRRGDLAEVQSLGQRLAEAHREYRELGGAA